MKRNLWIGAVVLVAALGVTGCKKRPGPPSEAFKQANALYVDLLKRDLEGAHSNPEIQKVLELISKVPDDSIDKAAAAALKTKVEAGIAEVKAAADARKAALAAIQAPVAAPIAAPVAFGGGQGGGAGGGENPGQGAAPAAVAGEIAAGTPVAAFIASTKGCFERTAGYTDDKGGQGDVYGLKASADCARSHPAYMERLVLVSGGKVADTIAKSQFTLTRKIEMQQNSQAVTQQVRQVAVPPPPEPAAPKPPADPLEVKPLTVP